MGGRRKGRFWLNLRYHCLDFLIKKSCDIQFFRTIFAIIFRLSLNREMRYALRKNYKKYCSSI